MSYITGYWKYTKWWHRIIRRKTVYFEYDGATMSFDGKTWVMESKVYKFDERN